MRAMPLYVAAAGLAMAGVAQADVVMPTDDAITSDHRYGSLGSGAAHYHGSFFDVFVDDWSLVTNGPPEPHAAPGTPGTVHGPRSGSTTATIRLNGLPPGEPVLGTLSAMSFFDVFVELQIDGTRVYDTEMLQMDILANVGGQTFMIRESPTRASTGRTTVRALADGTYRIDSFFDIFTELSVDGGATWIPADAPTHMTLLPAPGACALLGIGGLVATRRRR